MRKTTLFVVSTLVIAGCATFAAPRAFAEDVIFTESFGTGQTQNNIQNWDESGNDQDSSTRAQAPSKKGDDSASPDGGRFAKIQDGEWMCTTVDATGYENIQLSYFWRGNSDSHSHNHSNGIVEVNVYGDCDSNYGWHQVDANDLHENDWTLRHTDAISDKLNDTTFVLRFRADSNQDNEHGEHNDHDSNGNEYFRVDGISISGDQIHICSEEENSDTESGDENEQLLSVDVIPTPTPTPSPTPSAFASYTDFGVIVIHKIIVGGHAKISDFKFYLAGEQAEPDTEYIRFSGAYVVSEDSSKDYKASFSQDCNADGVVYLTYATRKVCTITNTYVGHAHTPAPTPSATPTPTPVI